MSNRQFSIIALSTCTALLLAMHAIISFGLVGHKLERISRDRTIRFPLGRLELDLERWEVQFYLA